MCFPYLVSTRDWAWNKHKDDFKVEAKTDKQKRNPTKVKMLIIGMQVMTKQKLKQISRNWNHNQSNDRIWAVVQYQNWSRGKP